MNYKKIIFLIIAAGMILRLFLFSYFLREDPKFFYDDDSYGYIQSAENVRLGNGFSWDSSPPIRPEGFRTPFYPLFLSGHRIIFGNYTSALITQIALIGAIAYLIFAIAKDFLNRPGTGLIASAVFLFSPFSLIVSLRFLTQTLFTFVLVLAVLVWLKFLKTSQNKYFLWSSVLFPIIALIRPIAFLILAPFFVSLLIYKLAVKNNGFNWRRLLTLFFIAIVIFVSVLSPWLLRNYRVFNSFSLSTVTYYQLYFYDLGYVYSRAKGIPLAEAYRFLEQDIHKITGMTNQKNTHEYARDFAYSQTMKQRLFYYLAQMPGTVISTRVELIFKFFIRDGVRYWINYFSDNSIAGMLLIPVILERVFLLTILAGMVVFITHTILSRNKDAIVFLSVLLLIIFYFASLTGVMASAGLRFPVEPLFLLLGLSGLDVVKRWFQGLSG